MIETVTGSKDLPETWRSATRDMLICSSCDACHFCPSLCPLTVLSQMLHFLCIVLHPCWQCRKLFHAVESGANFGKGSQSVPFCIIWASLFAFERKSVYTMRRSKFELPQTVKSLVGLIWHKQVTIFITGSKDLPRYKIPSLTLPVHVQKSYIWNHCVSKAIDGGHLTF